MDVAAYLFVGVGALILTFAGAHGFKNQSVTIVSFGAGAIFTIIGGCLYWQDAIWKKQPTSPDTNRPYVVVTKVTCDLDRMKDSEDARVIQVVLQNTSRTVPAVDVVTMTRAFLAAQELPDASKLPELKAPDGKIPSKLYVPPDTTYSMTVSLQNFMKADIVERIKSGELILYVYGHIEYEDRRTTQKSEYASTFCGIYDPITKVFQTAPFGNDVE